MADPTCTTPRFEFFRLGTYSINPRQLSLSAMVGRNESLNMSAPVGTLPLFFSLMCASNANIRGFWLEGDVLFLASSPPRLDPCFALTFLMGDFGSIMLDPTCSAPNVGLFGYVWHLRVWGRVPLSIIIFYFSHNLSHPNLNRLSLALSFL